MEDTLNKLVWIGVSVVIIMVVYGVLRAFAPKFTTTLTKKLEGFVTDAFDQVTGGDKNNGGKTQK